MKIGLDEWCYHNHYFKRNKTVIDFMRLAGELGVGGVGVDYFMLPRGYRAEPGPVRELLDEYGLDIVLGFGLPLALPAAVHRLKAGDLDRMFELASAWDVDVIKAVGGLTAPSGLLGPVHLCLNKAAELRAVAARLGELCDRAADFGMEVAIENHNDYRARELIDILDAADRPNARVALDTGNCFSHGDDPYETVELLAPLAAHTHIKDVRHWGWRAWSVPLGRGELDLERMIRMLAAAGYRGQHCIEVVYPPWNVSDEEKGMDESVRFLQGLVPNPAV